MPKKRAFSIITTCMGRLEHLKHSLPAMVTQGAEVIVVDYSCPEGAAHYVGEHFPQAKVARVEGERHFSNWKARNAGALLATGDLLLFCDADTTLAPAAVDWIGENLPPSTYGRFRREASLGFNKTKVPLGVNQLRGFQVIPAAEFAQIGGYDELMEGYAAGADTELEERLELIGLGWFELDPTIIADLIQHSNEDRLRRHHLPVSVSYGAGLLYRKAKIALMRQQGQSTLPPETRAELYKAAVKACRALGKTTDVARLTVEAERKLIGMPRQLGYRRAVVSTSLTVSITATEALRGPRQ